MKTLICAIVALACALPAPVAARGSKSQNDPAFKALLAAFMREKHCGKKMSAGGMGELIADAYPYNADPALIGVFAKDMRRRAEAAYRSMPKAAQNRSALCPQLEVILARWVVDKAKNPGRYR